MSGRAARQEFVRLTEEEKLLAERQRIALAELGHQHAVARQRTADELELDGERERAALATARARFELEASMTPVNLQKATLDALERLYARLPVGSVKLVNVGPGQGVESLLAQLVTAVREAGGEE